MTAAGLVLIAVGSLLALVAALGLHRLPDALSRMHAATKPAVLGLLLAVVGAAVTVGDGEVAVKLVLTGLLQLFTAPVAMHVVGRAVERRLSPPPRRGRTRRR